MDVKKFFCCVPIINVRQSVTLSQDKGCQYDSSINSIEVYKNINFTEQLESPAAPNNDQSTPPNDKLSISGSGRRLSADLRALPCAEKKTLCFSDIVVTEGTGSVSSVNTEKSGMSNHSTFLKTHAIDTSSVIEAHGLLTSLLVENDLPQHVTDTLRRVAKILDPTPNTGTPMLARMLTRGNQFGLKTDSDPSSDCEEEVDEDGKTWRNRYNGPSKRRLKVSVWSTVTSATGLPTLVPEPSGLVKKSSERKSGSSIRKKGGLDRTEPDISEEPYDTPDDTSYVTPWDRRLSKSVYFKMNPKKSACSLLTDTQKDYLLRPLTDEYECTSDFLKHVHSWNFPIFKFNESTQHCLSLLSFHIFSKTGLIDHFRINPVYFRNFFETIESGYHSLPYHNAIHAADVLQACYYLCSSGIPGFNNNSDDSNASGSDSDGGAAGAGSEEEFAVGILKDKMTELELLALFTAAAVHDYDHPGRTNAFLVAVGDTKAVMYNDRSVLESHHVASAWYLLTSDERYNFCSGLSATEFKRFRFLLIEAVLATDLKKHFDFLATLNSKMAEEGMDWSSPEDRILALQMCIKLADINAPCKEYELHCEWTDRIVEEFYQQGDDEAAVGMPVSAYMDRQRDPPKVPELQLNFIKHLVAPLYHAMASSCLVPGSWEPITEEEEEEYRQGSDLNCAQPTIMPHTHKFVSQLQKNLDSNYAVWKGRNEEYQASLAAAPPANGAIEEAVIEEEKEE